jgi:hypothetical protein
LTIARQETFDLLKKVIPVGVKGEERVIEIPLKHTVGTVHGTIGDAIDYIITAAEMIGGSRAGLQTPSIKMRDQEMFFPRSDRIGKR